MPFKSDYIIFLRYLNKHCYYNKFEECLKKAPRVKWDTIKQLMFNNYRHLNECYKQFLDCESFAMWGSRGIILFAKGGPRPIFSNFTMWI